MPERWLLLLHQIPPNPPYFRAKVLRRLNQLGALPIKNSAYVIPELDDTKEDVEWIRSEICAEGGDAWVFRAEPIAGLSGNALIEAFQELRAVDYKQLLYSARELLQLNEQIPAADLRKLKRRFEELRRIDFFKAPGREELENMIENIETTVRRAAQELAPKPDLQGLKGRTWVTRRGVQVDRIGCAGLIRRFIDQSAKFIFVHPDQYKPVAGHIRFA